MDMVFTCTEYKAAPRASGRLTCNPCRKARKTTLKYRRFTKGLNRVVYTKNGGVAVETLTHEKEQEADRERARRVDIYAEQLATTGIINYLAAIPGLD